MKWHPRPRIPTPLRNHLVTRSPTILAPAAVLASPIPSALRVLPPQGLQPLLLRVRVDVGPDHEADEVEERHPCFLRQESLGEGQGNGRRDPADLHDRHEPGADRRADLVEGTRAGDDRHAEEVDGVLDGCDL